MKFLKFCEQKFWLLFIFSIIGGLFFADWSVKLFPYIELFLMSIMYFSFLKVDFYELKKSLKDVKIIFLLTLSILIVQPIILFYLGGFLGGNVQIAMLLLAASPTAMASPALTGLLKGKIRLSISVLILSSFLSIITIPFLIEIFANAQIQISSLALFLSLMKIIFLPATIAVLTKKVFPDFINKNSDSFNGLVVLSVLPTIFAPLAKNADLILNDIISIVPIAMSMFAASILLHLMGWIGALNRPRDEKITGAISSAYMNDTVAVVLAAKYFSGEILIAVILYIFPWSLMLIAFKYFLKKLK